MGEPAHVLPRRAGDEDRRPVDRATVRRVVATFKPCKGKVGLVGLMIAITSGLGVINPLMIVLVFDKALFGPNGNCDGAPCPTSRCCTSTSGS